MNHSIQYDSPSDKEMARSDVNASKQSTVRLTLLSPRVTSVCVFAGHTKFSVV